MSTVYIYGLFDPRNGQLRYVGKTHCLKSRKSTHKHGRTTNLHLKNWINILLKEGLYPEFSILEESNDLEWMQDEVFWIQYMRSIGCPLVNIRDGGQGRGRGYVMPEETKRKLSLSNKWKKRSEEHCKRMSILNKGKLLGRKDKPEWIAKRIQSRRDNHPFKPFRVYGSHLPKQLSLFNIGNLGNKYSESTRLKLSQIMKGRVTSCGEQLSNLKIKDIKMMFKLREFGMTTKHIGNVFNIDQSQVSRITTGKRWAVALNKEVSGAGIV